MSSGYRRNHYVPEWYQKRFIPPEAKHREIYCLDKNAPEIELPSGQRKKVAEVRRKGPAMFFYEDDLYTHQFGGIRSTDLERFFFGEIDEKGREVVEIIESIDGSPFSGESLNPLVHFMSVQRMRTPKGLAWLRQAARTTSKPELLHTMTLHQQLFCAAWIECIWQIADANASHTKFIFSDHPVTIYNRRLGPRNALCKGASDPDIWFTGSHTLFPLSANKLLILTNRSWVRNPYESATKKRPHDYPYREVLARPLEIQYGRHMTEEEVRQVNFIIKSRAYRFVGSGQSEWLYPEAHVSKSDWARFGHGYLLMPDPREVAWGGTVYIGYKDGSSTAFDEFGRRPWNRNFDGRGEAPLDRNKFYRFQGEFSRLFGPYRRGKTSKWGLADRDWDKHSDELHQLYLKQEKFR